MRAGFGGESRGAIGWALIGWTVVSLVGCQGTEVPPARDAGTMDVAVEAARPEGDAGTTVDSSVVDADAPIPVLPGCSQGNSCDEDGDGERSVACGGQDCDDRDCRRRPGNAEVCDSMGHDEDCDPCTVAGSIDGDRDRDGFVASTCRNPLEGRRAICDAQLVTVHTAEGWVTGRDCADEDNNRRPDQVEVCNGVDDNCNGTVDEDGLRSFWPDCDGDSAGDARATAARQCEPTRCSGHLAVENHNDCNDSNGSVNPGVPETCNGVDDNCNDATDEGDPGGGGACNSGLLGICSTGMLHCVGAHVICVPDVAMGAMVESCNGRDDDCDGMTDEGDPGGGATCDSTRVGVCTAGVRRCMSGSVSCVPAVAPGTRSESCNGLDDDCDGETDEGDPGAGVCSTGLRGVCATGDGHCSGGRLVCTVLVTPGSRTETCNALDDDCDGSTDEDYPEAGPCPTGLAGVCATGRGDCATGRISCVVTVPAGSRAEVCNGLDDNCDGMTDEQPQASTSCGTPIEPHTAGACVAGRCVVTGCAGTFADCDRDGANGCESDLMWSAANCGACGHACGARERCFAGICDRTVQISAGMTSMCVLRASGRVACAGENAHGQFGIGTATAVPGLVPVVSVTDAAFISSARGGDYVCAVRLDGGAECSGDNYYGQLGDGTQEDRYLPTSVLMLSSVVKIATLFGHACALRADGTVWCWGRNTAGQCGPRTGSDQSVLIPQAIPGIDSAVDVAVGANHSCALLARGTVMCWGTGGGGQLGNGDLRDSSLPGLAVSLSNIVQIAGGDNHTCALLADGTVACWGNNMDGQLGDGTRNTRPLPVVVTGISAATQIALGSRHSCALIRDGSVRCWGFNARGMAFGSGVTGDSFVTPVIIAELVAAEEISAATFATCAHRASDGMVTCVGTLRGPAYDRL